MSLGWQEFFAIVQPFEIAFILWGGRYLYWYLMEKVDGR